MFLLQNWSVFLKPYFTTHTKVFPCTILSGRKNVILQDHKEIVLQKCFPHSFQWDWAGDSLSAIWWVCLWVIPGSWGKKCNAMWHYRGNLGNSFKVSFLVLLKKEFELLESTFRFENMLDLNGLRVTWHRWRCFDSCDVTDTNSWLNCQTFSCIVGNWVLHLSIMCTSKDCSLVWQLYYKIRHFNEALVQLVADKLMSIPQLHHNCRCASCF